jgi:hypothetical protein
MVVRRVRFQEEKDLLTIFGVYCSQEAEGELIIGAGPEEIMGVGQLRAGHQGKILLTGSLLSRDLISKGTVVGVVGFLAGGTHRRVLTSSKIPVCVVEGFGKLPLGPDLWEMLSKFKGRRVRLAEAKTEEIDGLKSGDQVRLVGDPGPIGFQGQIVGESKSKKISPGIKIKVAEVKADKLGKKIYVPLQNLEVI